MSTEKTVKFELETSESSKVDIHLFVDLGKVTNSDRY